MSAGQIPLPGELVHGNSNLAIADSSNVRGGRLSVSNLVQLYALVNAPDKLKEQVTVVYVAAVDTDYKLVDIAQANSAAGWEVYNSGGGSSTLDDVLQNGNESASGIVVSSVRLWDGSDNTKRIDVLPEAGLTGVTTITLPADNGTVATREWVGANVPAGDDGREVQLQSNATHLQWRYVGDTTWNNLIALTAITGSNGTNGTNGTNGWSPVLAVVNDGTRRVFQVADWTGGQGTKPTTGQYVGASGLVSDIASAVDVRGATGATGGTGATGNGISSIARTSGTGAAGTTDTYTITYTNGTTSTFTVYNGANGATGATGAAGADRLDVAFSSVLTFDQNKAMTHTVTAAINFTLAASGHLTARNHIIYLTANGVNKPTFGAGFTVVRDDYVNTHGQLNRLFMERLPNNTVLVEMVYI